MNYIDTTFNKIETLRKRMDTLEKQVIFLFEVVREMTPNIDYEISAEHQILKEKEAKDA